MATKRRTREKGDKRKRGNGEGSIYQRSDGTWCSALWAENGKRKVIYGRTRQDVADKLAVALADRAKGLPIAVERQTVAAFLTSWLEETAQHRLRPRTYVRYRQLVERHALPALGRVTLQKLTPQQLSGLYGAKLAEGLSPRTVQFLHAVLHGALRQALLWGLIPRNPADAVRAPRPKRHPMQPLDADQTRALLTAATGDPLEALYVLAVMTGMRQGELLGLRWSDVDWDAGRVQVRHTLQWLKGGEWRLDEPKTGHSRRSIRLPATALHQLKAHRARQNAERLALGALWADHDFIFPNTLGRPFEPSN
jgi:integrase